MWHARPEDVWPTGAAATQALVWLDAAERGRYERFRQPGDRAMFLLGRVMARTLVGLALGVPPASWRWREGERGRPEIDEPACGLSFNLAHSAGVVVCALARDAQVGVDIEYRRRPILDPTIVPRYCSPAEAADIQSQGQDGWHDQFLRYWTLKEAYLKARGLGIAVHLSDLSFELAAAGITLHFLNSLAGNDAGWAFTLRALGPDHFLATAVSSMGAVAPVCLVEPLPPAWVE